MEARYRNISLFFLYSILLLSFLIVISVPVSEAGFFGDDIVNSLLLGSAELFHLSLLQAILESLQNGMVVGRFYPLSVLSSVTMHYLFPHADTYQIVRLFFIWLSVFSFMWIIKLLTRNNYASLLLLLLFPMCWSIRNIPDPIVSYAIFIPLLASFIGFTLVFFLKYCETNRPNWLAVSLLMYASALSTYEIGITALFLLWILNGWHESSARSYKRLLPYLQLTIIFIIVNIIIRLMKTGSYDGIEFGNLSQFFMAFVSQLISTFPLSYLMFANEADLSVYGVFNWYIASQPHYFFTVAYLFVSSFLLFNLAIRRLFFGKSISYFLLLIGVLLMTIPAAIIALSGKYQAVISLGKGYLPVYFQYIGLSVVLVGFFNLLKLTIFNIKTVFSASTAAVFSFFIPILLSVLLVCGWVANAYTIAKLNDAYASDRMLLENAFHHQLIESIPQESMIVQRLYLWNTVEFFQLHAKKKFIAVVDTNAELSKEQNNYQKYYIDFHHLPDKKSGFVITGLLTSKHKNSSTFIADAVALQNVKVYISYQSLEDFSAIVSLLQKHLSLLKSEMQLLFMQAHQDDKIPNSWVINLEDHTCSPTFRIKV